MSIMKNSTSVVIQNQFFPKGINEQSISEYWKRNKSDILDIIEGKEVFFYVAPQVDRVVVRRYESENNTYVVNTRNYERMISSRVVGILSTMDHSSSFGIIDIDINPIDDVASMSEFNLAKEAAAETFDWVSRLYDCKLFYTGKNGFHIHCHFLQNMKIDKIKEVLHTQLKGSPLMNKYTLKSKRDKKTPNLDLCINKYRGGYITEHSLNKIGLPCIMLKRDNLETFRRESLIKEVLTE